MGKHKLKVAEHPEIMQGEKYLVFYCTKPQCPKYINIGVELVRAMVSGDPNFINHLAKTDLGDWGKCRG